jgi:hypothetical protein
MWISRQLPVTRNGSGLDQEHAHRARPIVTNVEAMAIRAHRQCLGVAADVDGIGDALRNRVDDRHASITEVADVGILAVGADAHTPG